VAGVLPKILGAINHKPLAAEEIDSIRYTFGIDFFSGAFLEILIFLEAGTIFYARFEHFSRLLTERRMFFMVRLKIPLPNVLYGL
jgi:hypothetical protein